MAGLAAVATEKVRWRLRNSGAPENSRCLVAGSHHQAAPVMRAQRPNPPTIQPTPPPHAPPAPPRPSPRARPDPALRRRLLQQFHTIRHPPTRRRIKPPRQPAGLRRHIRRDPRPHPVKIAVIPHPWPQRRQEHPRRRSRQPLDATSAARRFAPTFRKNWIENVWFKNRWSSQAGRRVGRGWR